MEGDFLAEGVYDYGTRLKLQVDLDGDGAPETVTFWFSVDSYKLNVTKHSTTFILPLAYELGETTRVMHVAIKDVTNDGLPEILLAAWDGIGGLRLYVWGFNEAGLKTREVKQEYFGLLAELRGQHRALILEGGTIVLPYGSQGFASRNQWNGKQFKNVGD